MQWSFDNLIGKILCNIRYFNAQKTKKLIHLQIFSEKYLQNFFEITPNFVSVEGGILLCFITTKLKSFVRVSVDCVKLGEDFFERNIKNVFFRLNHKKQKLPQKLSIIRYLQFSVFRFMIFHYYLLEFANQEFNWQLLSSGDLFKRTLIDFAPPHSNLESANAAKTAYFFSGLVIRDRFAL